MSVPHNVYMSDHKFSKFWKVDEQKVHNVNGRPRQMARRRIRNDLYTEAANILTAKLTCPQKRNQLPDATNCWETGNRHLLTATRKLILSLGSGGATAA